MTGWFLIRRAAFPSLMLYSLTTGVLAQHPSDQRTDGAINSVLNNIVITADYRARVSITDDSTPIFDAETVESSQTNIGSEFSGRLQIGGGWLGSWRVYFTSPDSFVPDFDREETDEIENINRIGVIIGRATGFVPEVHFERSLLSSEQMVYPGDQIINGDGILQGGDKFSVSLEETRAGLVWGNDIRFVIPEEGDFPGHVGIYGAHWRVRGVENPIGSTSQIKEDTTVLAGIDASFAVPVQLTSNLSIAPGVYFDIAADVVDRSNTGFAGRLQGGYFIGGYFNPFESRSIDIVASYGGFFWPTSVNINGVQGPEHQFGQEFTLGISVSF